MLFRSVVAEEVRELSGRTNEFSQQIRGNMLKIRNAVGEAEQTINAMASQDLNVALQSKQHVDNAMNEAQAASRKTAAAARDLSELTRQVEENVNTAVTSLQFQDMLTQLMGHVQQRLTALTQLAAALDVQHAATGDGSMAAARLSERAERLRQVLAAVRDGTAHNPVRQSSMDSGSVALF